MCRDAYCIVGRGVFRWRKTDTERVDRPPGMAIYYVYTTITQWARYAVRDDRNACKNENVRVSLPEMKHNVNIATNKLYFKARPQPAIG